MKDKTPFSDFDPNEISIHEGIFGLPFGEDHANVVILPVPWDVTSSYSAGSADGPAAILKASYQVDLFDPFVKNAWQLGLYMRPISKLWHKRNINYRKKAETYISALENGKGHLFQETLKSVNKKCEELKSWVKQETKAIVQNEKLVVLLGGDHSTPLGYIEALAEKHKSFSILQIDAHADLRVSFEDFNHSHASIMHNVLEHCSGVSLTQVGLRDYCEAEKSYMDSDKRITTFYDRDLKHEGYSGKTWKAQTLEIIETLGDKVYISFDIDGLDPKLCPNTGTPVPGGFEFEQIIYLLEGIVNAQKIIIGADLNEVSPGSDEWDANVGARLLFKLCNLLGRSNGLI
jgi:agmatinase